jgi:hypothetical protein
MKTVYKYPLEVEDKQILKLPVNSKILSANFQGNDLFFWALIDKDRDDTQEVTFYIHGTGHNITEDGYIFVNTVFINGLVFHVFYK